MVAEILAPICIGILVGITILFIFGLIDKHMEINSNVVYNEKLQAPRFKVEKIELLYSHDYERQIAKYTCLNLYVKKNDKVIMNRVVFFDEVNAWKLGDYITITKREPNC